jgi:murein L,D-transpeptidase YcbB/YkuD
MRIAGIYNMKWSFTLIFALLLAICFSFQACRKNRSNVIDTVACPIGPTVAKLQIADPYFMKKVALKTELLYRANGLKRMWLKRKKPTDLYHAFIKELRSCSAYGLDPEEYQVTSIEDAVEKLYDKPKPTDEEISKLEIRISASFFLFSTHLIEGRIRYAGAKEFLWKRGMPLENDIVLLMKMKKARDFRKVIEHLQPKDPQYRQLQKALAAYRNLQAQDTFPALPHDLVVKPGESAESISLVRQRLTLVGDYKGGNSRSSTTYDDELVASVKLFQRRHGLSPDGVLAGKTIQLLNVPMTDLVNLIELNLERMRWHPHIDGNEYQIIINVPEYILRVYRNDKVKLAMRVVLGSEFHATPVFYDTLKYVVFSPEWRVPQSIFLHEFLPRLRMDPSSFDPGRFSFYKNGSKIDPLTEPWADEKIDSTAYSVVEVPGEENSLGSVKFIMPNDFSIYLHDTPAVALFGKEKRAFSHGCIRVEKPVALAEYLLSDQKDWNENKIRTAMGLDEPTKVDLSKPYPVYITYRTAWVDENDMLNFRQDVYGHDERQLTRLAKARL